MSFQRKVFLISEETQKKSRDYDEIGEFKNGFAPVRNSNNWGFIDEELEEIVAPMYEVVLPFSEQELAAVRDCNGKWGFVNAQGEEICKPQYDDVWDFSPDGVALVGCKTEDGQRWNYGFINKKGEVTCKVKYGFRFPDAFELSANQQASGRKRNPFVRQFFEDPWAIGLNVIILDGKQGLVNKFGTVVIEPQYDEIRLTFSGEPFSVRQDEKYGFINSQGEVVIPLEYDSEGDWITETTMIISKDRKYGIIDETGKVLCPFKYEKIWHFINGYAAVQANGKLGFINEQFEEICKIKYASAYPFEKNGFARVTTFNGTHGYIDTNGKFFKKLPDKVE